MGTIYQRKEFFCRTCQRKRPPLKACRAAGHAIDVRIAPTYWVKYSRNGKAYAESSESDLRGVAKTLLAKREGAIADGKPVTNKKVTFADAAKDLLADYTTNKKRSHVVVKRRVVKHLTPFFEGWRMGDITTATVRAYTAHRQTQGIVNKKGERVGDVSNAEINRELALLKRMFSLAIEGGQLFHRPHIPMLTESAARTGFFEEEQFRSVVAHLPEEIRPLIQFAYITGWRIASEVLPLEWRRVDFDAGEIRLDAGTTKNGKARTFPMTSALRLLLETQDEQRKKLLKAGHIFPYVFFREVAEGRGGTKKPQRIISFKKAWKTACRKAGCPGRIPHDLRRTAIRSFVRSGTSENVAMKLSGHKTRSVFDRYDIVSGDDLRSAAQRLDDVAEGYEKVTTPPLAAGRKGRGARNR